MSICIDNKSCLKEYLTSLLPSVKAKLLCTVCLETPCNNYFYRYGKANVVKTLISLRADPNGKNKFDMTPLHHAAVEGSAEVIGPVHLIRPPLRPHFRHNTPF